MYVNMKHKYRQVMQVISRVRQSATCKQRLAQLGGGCQVVGCRRAGVLQARGLDSTTSPSPSPSWLLR